MNARRSLNGALVAIGLTVIGAALVGTALQAQSSARPLTAGDFEQHAPRGFGDSNNSWAQSMVWWRHALYVGTNRQTVCTSLFALWQFVAGVLGREFADTWLPYPPNDPTMSCALDGADLSLQAEIWRWTPDSGAWLRVFQSPLELDNPDREGKKGPYEIGIRGITPYTEPDGTRALYAFGVNSTIMWNRAKLPPPRILRSTDGNTFTPIPQTPGTFLGDLPFNPDHSSFRSPVEYKGKLFVLSGPVFGQGSLIGSADPAAGDDAWFLAGPPEILFYEMAVFNGWLYLGTFNPANGYAILKTRAEGSPPYSLVTVVPSGAYLPERPSGSVVSMHEHQGRLYVGTATQTEIIRINADDTWDLVVGSPRAIPLANGGAEWKYPISNLDAGFGHTLNDHAWQMDDFYRHLYVGTYNASIASKNDPVNGPLLQHNMGAHLYRSLDGWYYSAVTTNGFADPSDPQGGPFDYGFRTMASTPHGAFIGTTNDSYGLAIFRARPHGSNAPDPPDRLEIEPIESGRALLSWQEARRADSYQIWRAEINRIFVRDNLNFEGWNGVTGNKIPDTYVGPYTQIGTSQHALFIDSTVQADKRYMYYVVNVHGSRVSDQSNLVTFPLLLPPVTFAQLLDDVDRLEDRGRFRNAGSGPVRVRAMIAEAKGLAALCKIGDALQTLKPVPASAAVLDPDAVDLEILISKLERRLTLFRQFPLDVRSDEFCTYNPTSPRRLRLAS